MLCNVKSDHFILFVNTKFRENADDAYADQRAHNWYSNRYKNTDYLGGEKLCLTEYKAVSLSDSVD